MKDFTGDPEFPIWLIGDSPPEKWADKLDTPLDPRHPARHNIWTSVADPMQDRLYRHGKLRLDTSRLYIRNAMLSLGEQIQLSGPRLKKLLDKHSPSLVLTFGPLAFMIALYASGEIPQKLDKTTKFLGEEFRNRIENYGEHKINIIPLLHTSVARRYFLSAHRDFVGPYGSMPPNYFDYVGIKLADLLLAKLSDKPVWIV
jgi:uracil-DNA glycosylase